MDAQLIKNAAKKALMAADSQYHSWSAEVQEAFRANMSDDAQNRVDAVLLKEILNIQASAANASDIWRDLPLSKLNKLNWAKLLTTGIGDGMIFLNESMAENTSLLNFTTLYDYDFDDHLFQEAANKKEVKNYAGRDYYALRFSRWARLIIKDQFYYATLYSLAGYLTEQLEDQGSDIIQTLIPHKYIDGKNNGKPEQGGFRWDLQVDAAGLEKHLDELNSRWHHYTQQRWLALSHQFSQSAPVVYTEDKNEHGELHRNFIFNNERALKHTYWRQFLADSKAIQGDYGKVSEMEQQELAKAESWLQASHQDIMTNFDPNVIKLKKKRKIVIAPGAFDGIRGDDGDE
jgi:hypothetical protein